jgi:hypothetical protein
MSRTVDRLRQVLPTGVTGLAGVACVACCLIPLLLAAGVLGGAGWVIAGQLMPGIAVALVATTAVGWWWATRHRTHVADCAGAEGCSCAPRR